MSDDTENKSKVLELNSKKSHKSLVKATKPEDIKAEKAEKKALAKAELEIAIRHKQAEISNKSYISIRNYFELEVKDKIISMPRIPNEIVADVLKQIPDLFMVDGQINCLDENDKPKALLTLSALESYLGKRNILFDFKSKAGIFSPDAIFISISDALPKYERVSQYPLYPAVGGVLVPRPVSACATGALRQLVELFCPATEQDRILIMAMFATPAWSVGNGLRPLFVIAGNEELERGQAIGKSTLAEMIGELYQVQPIRLTTKLNAEKMEERITKFRASPIVLFDNVKSSNWSSEEVESWITSPVFQGRQNFVGPLMFPNHFTYIATLNDPAVSADLASRAVVIRLNRPADNSMWRSEVTQFINDRRADLFADIGYYITREAERKPPVTRFPQWELSILNKMSDFDFTTHLKDEQSKIEAKPDSKDFEFYLLEQLQRYSYTLPNNPQHYVEIGRHVSAQSTSFIVSSDVLGQFYAEWSGTKYVARGSVSKAAALAVKGFGEHFLPTTPSLFKFQKSVIRGYEIRGNITEQSNAHLQIIIDEHWRHRAVMLTRVKPV